MNPVESTPTSSPQGLEQWIDRQWRVDNRSGAYAAGTAAGMNTRRGHGMLVTPIARGAQRLVILSRVEETLRFADKAIELGCNEYPGTISPRGDQWIREFDCDSNSVRWLYAGQGWAIEKRLRLLDAKNTVVLAYRVIEGALALTARPLFALRGEKELMYQWNGRLSAEKRTRQDYRLPATDKTPEAFFTSDGAFDGKGWWYYNTIYRGVEESEGLEDLWSPGEVKWTLVRGQSATFACSVEPVTMAKVNEALNAPLQKGKPSNAEERLSVKVNPDVLAARTGKQVPLVE